MVGIAPEFNPLFHQWDLGQKLSAVAVPLIAAIWWLIRKDDDIVKAAGLEIKQAVTTMFMQTVIDEAHRFLKVLDEHLPIALSQETAAHPERSRFDQFCQSLRAINPEELEEDRGKYSAIIRDAFSGVIAHTISRLMESATSSSRTLGGELQNPTGLRLEMEGALHLKFAFVSRAGALAFHRQRRYYRLHNLAIIAFLTGSVCIFLLWFPLFVDARWSWYLCVTLLLLTALAIPVALTAAVLSYFCQQWLQQKAQNYRDKAGLLNEYSIWTKDHAG